MCATLKLQQSRDYTYGCIVSFFLPSHFGFYDLLEMQSNWSTRDKPDENLQTANLSLAHMWSEHLSRVQTQRGEGSRN